MHSPPVSIRDQPNPVHIPTSHLLEIHPNTIHPSTPRSPQWSPSLRFPHQDPIHPPLLTHMRHMHFSKSTNTNMYKIFLTFSHSFSSTATTKNELCVSNLIRIWFDSYTSGMFLPQFPKCLKNTLVQYFRSAVRLLPYFFRKIIIYHSFKISQSQPHKHSCLCKGWFIERKFLCSLIIIKNHFSNYSSESETVRSEGTM